MMRRAVTLTLVLGTLAGAATRCGNSTATGPAFQETLDIAICHQSAGPFTPNVTNPFSPLPVGAKWILEGRDDGDAIRLEITVLPNTELVAGVATRVLEERESANGILVEVSRNFFAQTADGTACYFGEDVDIYDSRGVAIVSHEGQWRAGVSGAVPGIFMPAAPALGMAFRQEVAPGVAEDRVVIRGMGESVTTPAGTFTNTVHFLETTPLEKGAESTKYYARGVGIVVDDVVRLISRTP